MRAKPITGSLWTLLAFLLGCGFASGQVLTQIRNAGPRANRINMVILSEGYTSGAEVNTKFPADAQTALNGFLNSEPYKEYAPYFNVFTIAIASPESGSDHPSTGVFKNTYFNSTYDSFGQDRLVTIPPNDKDSTFANGQGKVDALLAQFVPDYDLVLLIVNDTQYGGSGGPTSIASVNQSATEIAIHEIGHTFADLSDEYDIDAPQITPVEKANVTQQTTRSLIKWNVWILPSTPIPTPEDANTYGNVIGLFEGANYRPTGWYRPKYDCKMNHLGVPFCSPCAEALVLNIYKRIRPSDGASPDPSASASLSNSGTRQFSVTPLTPATHTLSLQWFLDNTLLQGATANTYNLAGSGLSLGQHTLRVDLRDQSAFVRNDAANNLTQSVSWTVNVNDGTTPGRLLNIATRMRVQTGDNVIIGGFIITGNDPKKVIIRGIGPSLAQLFAGTLPNPTLELLQGSTSLATNDDWKTAQAEVESSGVPPTNDLESAIVRTLAPGGYTAVLRGTGTSTGIGVVEVYDLNQTANSKLANIATRGFVETGDNVMIGGVIVGPAAANSIKVVVRAIGPTLGNFGVAGTLQNPTLELVTSNGVVIRSNNDWQESQKTEIESFNLAPGDTRESALVETLAPGNYTAVVRGVGNTAGVALVEVYNVQ